MRPQEDEPDTVAPDTATLHRAIAASAIGNAVEWYDATVYVYVAGTIGAVFFPSDDPAVQTLSAFAVFAVAFVVRPLGSLVLGPFGDRIGRRPVLAFSIVLMSAATLAVGLLPGYATIGLAAPVLLVVLRLIQGFSTGGEYGGAATYIAEYAPDRRRGFYGSFLEVSTLAGGVLAATTTAVCYATLSEPAMTSWGWRIPFLIGGPLGIVGLYLRLKLEETPVFRELERTGATPPSTGSQARGLATHVKMVLICVGLVLMVNIAAYTLLAYMPTYLAGLLEITGEAALWMTVIVMVMMMAAMPLFGRLSDQIGRKPLWYGSALGLLLLSYPMFALMSVASWVTAVIAYVVLGLLLAIQMSLISATFPALFPAHLRYAGLAISYSVSVSLFGGTAPLVIDFMIPWTTQLFPAWYLMAACVIGLAALAATPESAGSSLRGTELPGAVAITRRRRHG